MPAAARPMLVLVALAAMLGSGGRAEAATIGALTVRVDVEVVAQREVSPRLTTWSVAGAVAYSGLLEQRDSSISQYGQTAEPLATWEFVSVWPSKVDVGGLEGDAAFVCGVVAVAVGGPCFAAGELVGVGTAHISAHDLRPGGWLVWELVFPRAFCLRCRPG